MRLKKKEVEVLLKALKFYNDQRKHRKQMYYSSLKIFSDELIKKIHNRLEDDFTKEEKEWVLEALDENIAHLLSLLEIAPEPEWSAKRLKDQRLKPMKQLKLKFSK